MSHSPLHPAEILPGTGSQKLLIMCQRAKDRPKIACIKDSTYHTPYTSNRHSRWHHGFLEERTIAHLLEAGTQLGWPGGLGRKVPPMLVEWLSRRKSRQMMETTKFMQVNQEQLRWTSGHQALRGAEPVS